MQKMLGAIMNILRGMATRRQGLVQDWLRYQLAQSGECPKLLVLRSKSG
jgi:hypothetical protein